MYQCCNQMLNQSSFIAILQHAVAQWNEVVCSWLTQKDIPAGKHNFEVRASLLVSWIYNGDISSLI